MITKKVTIDGQEITFGASGGTPLRYRILTGRDVIADMQTFDTDRINTDTLENLAYVMFCQANQDEEISKLDFLDKCSMMGLLEAYPAIMELWTANTVTTSKAKKK